MEEKLTSYVVELNKRGRPPTRGEVKNLGQLLSTVSDFRGSKGWLDKYLNRVKEDMKHKDARFKELFRLLSYADLRKVEAKKPILSCLAEIGASDEFIQKFQEMSHDKPLINQSHSYFEDTDDANCKEEEENISRKKIFTEKDKALYHFSNRENVYLEDNETKLQAWRNPVSESLK